MASTLSTLGANIVCDSSGCFLFCVNLFPHLRLTEAVTDSGEGWTTYAALAGGDRAGAVVEQNTAAVVSAEESKLCAVRPFKASSLKKNLANECPNKRLSITTSDKSV